MILLSMYTLPSNKFANLISNKLATFFELAWEG